MTKSLRSYYHLIFIFSLFILFGLIIDRPHNILKGLKEIIINSDILVTDYIALTYRGAAFVNSGLTSLSCVFLLVVLKVKPNGSTLMALFMMTGFSFFGKNILNIWPLIFGVWLHAKYQREPFLNYILIAILGTALSPIVSQIAFTGIFPSQISLFLGIISGIIIGSILPPLSAHCTKLHQGYNLYNIGLSAGLIGTLLMSIFRAFGIDFPKRLLWASGNNLEFLMFLITIFLSLIIIGFFKNNKSFKNTLKITKHSGRLITDYLILYGGAAYINMGILGLFSTVLVLLIGGDLNGPTIGGIFTIVGFGAFGKHLKNIIPILIGAILCGIFSVWDITSPQVILAILFSTTLAPIAGQYGFFYGVAAGFIHVCIVMNTAYLHGGLNLYNNGLAGGLVAIILIPIINSIRKDSSKHAIY